MGRAAASAHALWLRSRCWLLRNALCLRSLRVVLFAAAAAAVAVAAVATAAAAVAATAAACFSGPISRRRRHSRVARCCSSCLSLSVRVRRVCFFYYFLCVFVFNIEIFQKKERGIKQQQVNNNLRNVYGRQT